MDVDIPEENNCVKIEAVFNEFYGITQVTQNYKNQTPNPIELNLTIPLKPEIQFSQFRVQLDDKIIVSRILDKEKAEGKYIDSIAQGNTGIISSYNEKEYGYHINLGNLNPGSNVIITTEFIQFLSSEDLSYCFSVMENYLSLSNNLTYTINIKAESKITRLISRQLKERCVDGLLNITNNNDKTNYTLNFTLKPESKYNEPIKILFRTENMNEKKLIKQYNPELDETSFLLSMIYNPIKIPITEETDFDENKNYFNEYESNQINDNPSLFIFLIDQSGSMSGQPIKLVYESLLFFLQSLPKNSYFQLIGFGTDFKKINETPQEYTKENVLSTKQKISNLNADLGGTDISSPLKEIFNSKDYDNISLCRNLFILTDGEVDDSEECLELISNNSEKFKVHSIGIGDDFDKNLIEKSGIQGKGSYHFVHNIEQINSVIIQCLNQCLKPYIIDSKFKLSDGEVEYEFIPKDVFYQDEILTYSFMKKGKHNDENIKINFNSTEYNNGKKSLNNEIIKIPNKNILELPEGDILSKIIIGNILKNNSDTKINEQEIALSIKYKILSKKTSLFAEIENESKIIGELKKIDLTQKKINNNNYINSYNACYANCDDDDEDEYDNECYDMGNECCADDDDDDDNNMCEKACYKKNFVEECNNCELDEDSIEEKISSKEKENDLNVFSMNKENEQKKISDNNFNIKEMALSQDIFDGYWESNDHIKYLIEKNKSLYEQFNDYFMKNNCKDEKIVITAFVVYYLKHEKSINQSEFLLIYNKAIKFLKEKSFDYQEIEKNIK